MALRVFVAAELSFNCWGEMPISLEFADTGSDRKQGKLETVGKGGASVLSVLHCPIKSNYTFLCILILSNFNASCHVGPRIIW